MVGVRAVFEEDFDGGGRDPREEWIMWAVLIVVALLVLVGFVAHHLVFGAQ